MPSLIRAAAPAVAVGGAAVALVALFDPALAGVGATTGTSAAGAAGATSPAEATGRAQPSAGGDAASPVSCDTAELVAGPVAQTRWGPVQVAARVVDGRVCQAQALVWPDGDSRSAQINAYAIPQLDAMASEQGTQFDAISGATVTSEGYRASLQALLDGMG